MTASEFKKRVRAAALTDADIELCARFTCADHNDPPFGGPEFSVWAERMNETHKQLLCGECLLWRIWVPR